MAKRKSTKRLRRAANVPYSRGLHLVAGTLYLYRAGESKAFWMAQLSAAAADRLRAKVRASGHWFISENAAIPDYFYAGRREP